MAARSLPAAPSLKSLRNQAKQLLHGHRAGTAEAIERIRACHPRLAALSPESVRETPFSHADALLVIAREYGFESWSGLLSECSPTKVDSSNEPGWTWAWAPEQVFGLAGVPRSGLSAHDSKVLAFQDRDGDSALYVHLAASEELAHANLRAIGLDESGTRYPLQQRGTDCSGGVSLMSFCLPHSEVPHGVIRYVGIEIRDM